jgi:hypothetical protein
MEVPDLGHIPSSGGSEVRNTEAARREHVSAGSRGPGRNRGTQRTHARGRCAVRSVCRVCRRIMRNERRDPKASQ